MKEILKILGGTFRDLWSDLWTVLACNFFWLIANVLIIPGPPATLAVMYYANRIAHGEQADLADFWGAFRGYWGPAWRWGVVNLAMTAFLIADIAVTAQFPDAAWKYWLQGLYVVILVVWLGMQFYALPFLFEQEQMKVRQALRNSIALIGRNLRFTLMLWLMLLLILAAGTFAFLLSAMFGTVFLACAGNRAVLNRLEVIRQADTPV